MDDQGKTHITFSKLQQTLKAMENDNYSTNLPDTVIVRAKCVQFGKLVTSNRLYSLVLYFDDPDQATGQPVQIVFSNDVIMPRAFYSCANKSNIGINKVIEC